MIELKTGNFWKATIALGMASFFAFANVYFPQPLLPVFSEQFSVNAVTSSLVVSLVLLTFGCSFFIYSAISDTYGRKNVLIAAMVLATLLTFLIPLANSFELLLFFRILQAFALAGVPTVCMTYIGEEFSFKALTLAMGIYISANTVGGMGGRLISGVVTDWWNWQMAFITMGIISIICIFFVLFLLPAPEQFRKKKFRLRNLLCEYKNHLTDKALVSAYLVGGLHFLVFIGIYNYITFYLSGDPFFVSSTTLGFLFLTYIAGTFSSTLAGKAAQKIKQSVCIAIGILIMIAGMALTMPSHLFMIACGLVFLSFGFFFAHSCSSAWVTKYAKAAKGSASSIYLTSYYLGGSLGSFYLGFFWHYFHWSGVLFGSLIILIITSFCTLNMYRIERSSM